MSRRRAMNLLFRVNCCIQCVSVTKEKLYTHEKQTSWHAASQAAVQQCKSYNTIMKQHASYISMQKTQNHRNSKIHLPSPT